MAFGLLKGLLKCPDLGVLPLKSRCRSSSLSRLECCLLSDVVCLLGRHLLSQLFDLFRRSLGRL